MRRDPTCGRSGPPLRSRLLRRAARRALVACGAGLVAACGGRVTVTEDAVGDTTSVEAASATQAATPTGAPAAVPPGDTAAAGPRDACSVLPAAEVSAVLGQPVRDSVAMYMAGRGGGGAIMTQCNYATASDPVAASLMVRRSGRDIPAAERSRSVRQALAESGAAVEDVAGIGEAAFWTGNQLHVITATGLHLAITPTPAGGRKQARALATRVLARL